MDNASILKDINYLDFLSQLNKGVIIQKILPEEQGAFKIIYVNSYFTDLLSISSRELLTEQITLDSNREYPWLYTLLNNLKSGIDSDFEYHITELNKFINIHSYGISDDIRISLIDEITDQKKETRDLNKSQHLSKIGHYNYYITEDCWTSSDSLNIIFGITPEYHRSFESWIQIIHPDFVDSMIKYFQINILTNHEPFDKKYKIITLNTLETKWVHGKGSLTFDADGNPIEMFGTISDITEQMNIEEQLREINKTKDKFFSIISHDLRGPLSHIKLLTEALSQNMELNHEEFVAMLHKIRMTVNNTCRLLENLLLWAESQQDHLSINIQPYNLKYVIHDCIDQISGLAHQKSITLISELDSLTAPVDRDMLTFIIRNLLTNSIKFTSRGGEVKIRLYEHDDKIKISILDNGIGIPEEKLKSLFQFNAIKKTRGTEHEKGTGLGLLLCHQFIELNQGVLNVSSELGKGSIFTLEFPKSNKVVL